MDSIGHFDAPGKEPHASLTAEITPCDRVPDCCAAHAEANAVMTTLVMDHAGREYIKEKLGRLIDERAGLRALARQVVSQHPPETPIGAQARTLLGMVASRGDAARTFAPTGRDDR